LFNSLLRRHLFRHHGNSNTKADQAPAHTALANEFIPLNEAAKIAWAAIQGTDYADEIEERERSPSKILNTVAFQMLAMGHVWGCKFPATERTNITNGRILNVLADGLSLAYTSQQEAIVTDAAVKPRDLDEFVRYARSVSGRI
jgi:hypothetical protein